MGNTKAFSFVELIVSVTILSIISTIWFISYSWYLWDSRDSQRKSDLAQVGSALKVYKQKRGYYPVPGQAFNINYNSILVANQWDFDNNVRLNTLDRLVMDPKTKNPYLYSITKNKQEYEMASTLENEDEPIALVAWTYKSASKNILPWIILAIEAVAWTNIEIQDWNWDWTTNRDKFIFNNQLHNLPYEFYQPYTPFSDDTPVETILSDLESNNEYWQNTDFRNCLEIVEAWKDIVPFTGTAFEYQIISNTWALSNTWCTL